MSLLEGLSITLADGSTISFEQKGDGWEVCALKASNQLTEALEPHLMDAQELVLNCFAPFIHGAPPLPSPQTIEESARLKLLAMEHLICPFLRLEPVGENGNINDIGALVRLVYVVEDGHIPQKNEDFELLVSTVIFAIQL